MLRIYKLNLKKYLYKITNANFMKMDECLLLFYAENKTEQLAIKLAMLIVEDPD